MSCSASSLQLAGISVDRFLAVIYPLRYGSIMKRPETVWFKNCTHNCLVSSGCHRVISRFILKRNILLCPSNICYQLCYDRRVLRADCDFSDQRKVGEKYLTARLWFVLISKLNVVLHLLGDCNRYFQRLLVPADYFILRYWAFSRTIAWSCIHVNQNFGFVKLHHEFSYLQLENTGLSEEEGWFQVVFSPAVKTCLCKHEV